MNDDPALERDPGVTGLEGIEIRELTGYDLDAVARLDARITGRSRREYLRQKIEQAAGRAMLHVSLAAELDGTFAGFLIARLYYGEFGVPEPVAIVDTIGVEPELRHRHVGHALFHQLAVNLRGIGIDRIRTEVEWTQLDLLGFLAAEGFAPAPVLCLERSLGSE